MSSSLTLIVISGRAIRKVYVHVIFEPDSKAYDCGYVYCIRRSGWTRNAEILSLWRHRQHGFTHGINRRRLSLSSPVTLLACGCF